MTIGIGILGSGYMGRSYAACLTNGQVPAGRLAAVWGGKRAPALAREFGTEAVDSLETLVARPDVDAVLIASPHSAHLAQAQAAAAAGKHVYVEKPMAVTVADCDEMIAACNAAGVKLTVNFVTRFRHAPMAAKKLIDEGAIGDIRLILMRGVWTGYFLNDIVDDATGRVIIPAKPWAIAPGEGTQFLGYGVHEADAMRWWTGSEAARVYAEYTTFDPVNPEGVTAAVVYTLRNGVIVTVLMSYELPEPGLLPPDGSIIVGSRGIIEVDHYGKVRLGRADAWEVVTEQVPFNFLGDYLDPNRLAGFAAQVQDFCEAIRDNREPAVTGADGRAAVEMVEAADRSAAGHTSIEFPL